MVFRDRLVDRARDQVLGDVAQYLVAEAGPYDPRGHLPGAEPLHLGRSAVAARDAVYRRIDRRGRDFDGELLAARTDVPDFRLRRRCHLVTIGRGEARRESRDGAKGGTRTPIALRLPDPKSGASASSATFASRVGSDKYTRPPRRPGRARGRSGTISRSVDPGGRIEARSAVHRRRRRPPAGHSSLSRQSGPDAGALRDAHAGRLLRAADPAAASSRVLRRPHSRVRGQCVPEEGPRASRRRRRPGGAVRPGNRSRGRGRRLGLRGRGLARARRRPPVRGAGRRRHPGRARVRRHRG